MAYQSQTDSVLERPLPQWFDQAKLGLLIHWGPYSVPSWAVRCGTMQELWVTKWPSFYFKLNP